MRVLTVVGARPQYVKAFPVCRALADDHDNALLDTGQHYDRELSDVFYDQFDGLEATYDLGVGSDSHARQTAAMLAGIEEVLEEERPDAVLTVGDTNSTLAAALATAKDDPLLAHVEAGLRSGNRSMPEEVNRVLTDHVSDLLFAPTERAVENLQQEGFDARIRRTGDVTYDVLRYTLENADPGVADELGVDPGEFVLATVHRPRNTDDSDRLEQIVEALGDVDAPVVFPAHPRTVDRLEEAGLYERATDAVDLVDPLGYAEFVHLLAAADRVATDSGGVQKEAFLVETPCVTLREETEWVETVACGWNELVGADPEAIREALTADRERPDRPPLYGDGNAAQRIVEELERAA